MNTTPYKLLALDLDGTLLNDQKIITPATLDSLIALQQQGVRLVLATGRPTYGAELFATQLRLADYDGFIISYNGGKLTSCRDRSILVRNTLDMDLIPQIAAIVKRHALELISYRRSTLIAESDTDPGVLDESAINNDMDITVVEDIVDAIDRPPFMCTVVADPQRIALLQLDIEKELADRVSIHVPAPRLLNIVPLHVDKARTLDFLLRELGITRREMVAIGDSYNDVEMISNAGLGVAMANATEAVKACADYVTLSNNKDGVAHMIKKYFTEPTKLSSLDLNSINALTQGTLMGNLGIQCTYAGQGRVEATMPVDLRTRQPMGILHGGASLALAETVAGFGSVLLLGDDEIQVGMQVSGNHVSSAHEGEVVRAVATIMHQGRSTHVWNVDISTLSGKLICTARVVNSILRKR